MSLNVTTLFDLKPQDRVITMTQAAYGLPSQEVTLYVECADALTGVVHALSPSGNRLTVPFANILDVEICTTPVTLVVADGIWDAHQCDPAYRGRPVRAIAAMLGERGNFSGLCIPKWPGSRPGHVLHINVTPNSVGVSEADILGALPTNRVHRFHDPDLDRNRTKRMACNRIKRFIEASLSTGMNSRLPVDPSLKAKDGLLLSRSCTL